MEPTLVTNRDKPTTDGTWFCSGSLLNTATGTDVVTSNILHCTDNILDSTGLKALMASQTRN